MHLIQCSAKALKHWYKHILHHYASHAATTGRTFSNPQGAGRKKTDTLWLNSCFYFYDLSHKLLPALTLSHWESHFSIKGQLRKPNEKILPSSRQTLSSCNAVLYQIIWSVPGVKLYGTNGNDYKNVPVFSFDFLSITNKNTTHQQFRIRQQLTFQIITNYLCRYTKKRYYKSINFILMALTCFTASTAPPPIQQSAEMLCVWVYI